MTIRNILYGIVMLGCVAGVQAAPGEPDDPAVSTQSPSPVLPSVWTSISALADSAAANGAPQSWELPSSIPGLDPGRYRDPRVVDKVLDRITVGGYVRMLGWQRKLDDPFVVIPSNMFANTPPYVIGIGDVYRDPPLALLNIGARPNSRTYVGMDFAIPNFFTGNLDQRPPLNLNLGVNLTGSISTELGRFGIQAGGINWTSLSPLTLGAPELFRFSLFERSPWDANQTSIERVDFLYDRGQINVDERFGQQAFKGLWLDGSELPGNTAFRLLYGKTPVNADLTRNAPNYTVGGYLRKYFGSNYVAYNTINYINFFDSLAEVSTVVALHTASADFTIKDWRLRAEAGLGRKAVAGEGKWGEGLVIKIASPARHTGIPMELQVFRLRSEFTNFFGSFLAFNASLQQSAQTAPSGVATGTAASFAGSITDVGQFSNNQQGLAFNTRFNISSLKINVGIQASQELERNSSLLSFGHKINALPMSRFVPFSNGVGSYGRWNSFFRGVSETLAITDLDTSGLPLTRNGFNTIQLQAVQRVRFADRTLYLTYLGSLGSVQDKVSPIPVYSDAAYLRAQYHELDAYLELTDWLNFLVSYGRERIRGNDRTARGDDVTGELGDPENSTLDQKSRHLGFGLDVKISDEVGFFIRHRRFQQRDEGFVLDDIRGQESSLEFKIFF